MAALNSLAGLSEDSIHIVGKKGEIWNYDGSKWSVATPTDKNLTKIIVTPEGVFFICGHDGVLLKGCRNQWEILDSPTKDTFWGLTYFNGAIYAATSKNLYKISKHIERIDLNRKFDGLFLCSNDHELWSMEEKELWRFDECDWTNIDLSDCPK